VLADHVGRTSAIQTFYPAHDGEGRWVEHAPPTLPQAKKSTFESAAIKVYKSREEGRYERDSFRIHRVVLQSPYLRDVLETTLSQYGIRYQPDGTAESLTPHRALFHALDRIAELSSTSDDEITRSHCGLLATLVEEIHAVVLGELEQLDVEQKITYELLWTLFPIGSIFVTHSPEGPLEGFKVKKWETNHERAKITAEKVQFDGHQFGTVDWTYRIYDFDGAVPVSKVPGLLLIDPAKDENVRTRLISRAMKALDMQSVRYMTYPKHANLKKPGARLTSAWLERQARLPSIRSLSTKHMSDVLAMLIG
jgi:hypothetical protein